MISPDLEAPEREREMVRARCRKGVRHERGELSQIAAAEMPGLVMVRGTGFRRAAATAA